MIGSPPHTRGRSVVGMIPDLPRGFTPAYAGKIYVRAQNYKGGQVHPRIRGEDYDRPVNHLRASGSPPHTRGRLYSRCIGSLCRRFTPAYAGKIVSFPVSDCFLWVHPRIRGEDRRLSSVSEWSPGSPPHTRGRSAFKEPKKFGVRFTPAYAGKILVKRNVIKIVQVHPRIRGEDFGQAECNQNCSGSPPHTRGR